MKKIISLVFASIICSQVVFPSGADLTEADLMADLAAKEERVLRIQQQLAALGAPVAMQMQRPEGNSLANPIVIEDDEVPSVGCCGWAMWLLGSCFGGCARVAEVVEGNPLMSCLCLSMCCCGCGYATSTVMATEPLTPGVLAVCSMCKSAEYTCSLISLGCASGRCGTRKVIKACAHCVSDLGRRAQHACLPAEHME